MKKNIEKTATNDASVKKGYNEKNPTEPQGAFAPDAANEKTKEIPKRKNKMPNATVEKVSSPKR